MNILWLNRYDPLSVKSGGAEKSAFEIIKRLVENGHTVTWFASKQKKSNEFSERNIQGFKVVRGGNLITSMFFAFFHYVRNHRKYDLIIDEFHGFNFFTNLYAIRKKKFILIHEVAGPIWNYEAKYPVSFLGRVLEKFILSMLCKNSKFICPSNSTKDSLVEYGVNPKNISVYPVGIEKNFIGHEVMNNFNRQDNNIIYTGGLRRMKRIEDLILTIKFVKEYMQNIKLILIGNIDSKYKNELNITIENNKLEDNIIFTGRITDEKKNELIRTSKITLHASVREGWGISVSEANYFGLPAVVYNVEGLRDSVVNEINGLVVNSNSPEDMAKAVIKLLKDKELYSRLSKGAFDFANNLDWAKTYNKFVEICINGN